MTSGTVLVTLVNTGLMGPPGAGGVAGPASAVAGRFALFADITGKLLSQSTLAPSDLVPITRTINGQALSANIVLGAADVGADASGAATAAVAAHVAFADPHTAYQLESEKGAAGGYASLDVGGTVPDAQIPAGIARDTELTAAVAAHAAAADPHTGYRLESVPISAADVAADVATQAELDAEAALARNADNLTSGTIAAARLAQMPANTIKGNNTGSLATPIDLTVAQVKTMLNSQYLGEFATWASLPAASSNIYKTGIVTGLNNSAWFSDGTNWLPFGGRQTIFKFAPASAVTHSQTTLGKVPGTTDIVIPANLGAIPGAVFEARARITCTQVANGIRSCILRHSSDAQMINFRPNGNITYSTGYGRSGWLVSQSIFHSAVVNETPNGTANSAVQTTPSINSNVDNTFEFWSQTGTAGDVVSIWQYSVDICA